MNNIIQIHTRTWLSCRSSSPNINSRGRDPLEVEGIGSHGVP